MFEEYIFGANLSLQGKVERIGGSKDYCVTQFQVWLSSMTLSSDIEITGLIDSGELESLKDTFLEQYESEQLAKCNPSLQGEISLEAENARDEMAVREAFNE